MLLDISTLDISATIIELGKYGILGIFLIISIFVIKYLYTEQKTAVETALTELKEERKEFKEYLKEVNAKLFDVVDKNTSAFELMTKSYDKNTLVNEKFAQMIENKIELIDFIQKTKTV